MSSSIHTGLYRTATKEDITGFVTVHRGALSPDKIPTLKWKWKQSPTPFKRLAAIYACWEKRK